MFCSVCLVVLLFVVLAVLLLALLLHRRSNTFDLNGAHVLVTGGSSGIGLAVAVKVAAGGANVTLLARNPERLAEAKLAVESARVDRSKQKVVCVSVDVSKDYEAVERAIRQAEATLGPVSFLVNSAGFSVSGQFEDIPLAEFSRMLSVNYLGSVHATRAVLPAMKVRGAGRVVFVSSQAGQTGLFGFSAYSASKFALRGLAESLQMEVRPYGIRVTLSFPPDTATPGYEEEMKTKPEETRLISESSGLFQPVAVAEALVADALHGRFVSHVGVDGWLLAILTSGMTPVTSALDLLQQVALMGLFRAISVVFLFKFDAIVSRCRTERLRRAEKSKNE